MFFYVHGKFSHCRSYLCWLRLHNKSGIPGFQEKVLGAWKKIVLKIVVYCSTDSVSFVVMAPVASYSTSFNLYRATTNCNLYPASALSDIYRATTNCNHYRTTTYYDIYCATTYCNIYCATVMFYRATANCNILSCYCLL